MKRVLLFLAALLVLAVGAALVVPSFIDWNPYRDEVAARIEAATGRAAGIDGALSFRVLPSPTLSVDGVRLANVEGGSTRDMARIEALRVAVDLVPLLRGEIRVRSVRVIEPVVLLERLADGRINWSFSRTGDSGQPGGAVALPLPGLEGSGSDDPARGDTGSGPTVRLDNVRIEDGLVVFKDHSGGTETRAEAIDLTLSAESLRGPYRLRGDATARAVPVAFDLLVGALDPGRATQVKANVLLPETGDTLDLSGSLAGLGAAAGPTFSGDLTLAGGDLAATLGIMRGASDGGTSSSPTPVPATLARAFSLAGSISATVDRLDVSDLRASLGEAEVRGAVGADLNDTGSPTVEATLRLRPLDVDAWMQPGTADGSDQRTAESRSVPTSPDNRAGKALAGLSLPEKMRARVDLSADALTWRGGVVRQLGVIATLVDGRLTIEEAGASLPGAARIGVSAVVTTDEPGPRVQGNVRARAGDLRDVLAWLGVTVDAVPADRLRAFSVEAAIEATPDTLSATDIDLTLDTSRATGAVVARVGARLGLGLNLRVDSLNLDAYVPGLSTRGEPSRNGGNGGGDSTDGGAGLTSLATVLDAVDANFRVAVGTLTVDALPLTNVLAEGALKGGTLMLESASIEDVAGLRVAASGGVADLGGSPRAEGLRITANTGDLGRAARLLRLDLPAPLRALGAVTQSVTLSGTPDALDITTATRADDGGLDVTGRVTGLTSGQPAYDLAIDLRHPSFEGLARRLAPGYAPRGAPLGAVALATQARGDLSQVTLSDLDARVGNVQATGQARLSLDGPRPHIAAGISTTALPVDAFLPVAREARRSPGDGAARVLPASFSLPRPDTTLAPTARNGVALVAWATTPVDLSALTLVDADVNLRAAALAYGGQALENADLSARLRDGVLQVDRLTGTLYGGATDGTLTVVAGAPATYDMHLSVDGFSVARLLGLDGPVGAAGTGVLDLDMGAEGDSMATVVAALTGAGALTLSDLDIRAGQVRGTALAGLLEPVAALNDLAGSLMGDLGRAQRLADLDGRFTIDRGVVAFDPVRLLSTLYQGTLSGTLDLPAWTIDAEGAATLAEGPLRQALDAVIRLPESIPIRIAGAVEAPTVTIRTASLPTSREALERAAEDAVREQGRQVIEGLAPRAEDALRRVLPGLGITPHAPDTTAPARSGMKPETESEPAGTTPPPSRADDEASESAPEPAPADSPEAVLENVLRGLGQ